MYFAPANLTTWLQAWWQLAQARHLDFATLGAKNHKWVAIFKIQNIGCIQQLEGRA